jgi:crotonobetaine/carnitine-CoA ligase
VEASKVPGRDDVVTRYVVERHATAVPDKTCLIFEDGSRWTFGDARSFAYCAANALADRDVKRGDTVLVFLPNGEGWLRAFFGASFLGAVTVPINPAFRGPLLRHLALDSLARVVVTEPVSVSRLEEVDVHLDVVTPRDLCVGASTAPLLDSPLQPWDLMATLYTSGTTGPSKGVMRTYMHGATGWWYGWRNRVRPDDVVLIDIPLFHSGGQTALGAHLWRGASAAIRETFTATRYWDVVREVSATCTSMVGIMGAALEAQPPKPDDHDNPMRWAMMSPLVADPLSFIRRFGMDGLYQAFGSTEAGSILFNDGPVPNPLSIGRPRPGVEVRVVDEHDNQLPTRSVGELVVRTDRPWELTAGYWRLPEYTVEAFRNGWFHTGDVVQCDESGQFFFVGRVKDMIRRHGENISCFEVEREALAHPAVFEAACIGVHVADTTDEEVKLFVVAAAGHTVDPKDLVEYLVPRMPYFMVPRFVEITESLPKTHTNKIAKAELPRQPQTGRTWDREAAGMRVDRNS